MQKQRVLGAIAVLLLVLSLTISADSGYNTKDDPLITLSYFNQFKKEVTDSIKTQVGTEVRSEMQAQINSKIQSEVSTQVNGDFRKTVSSEVRTLVERNLQAALEKELRESMLPDMKAKMKAELEKQLLGEIETEIAEMKTLEGQLQSKINAQLKELNELDKQLAEKTDSTLKAMEERVNKRMEELEAEVLAKVEAKIASIPEVKTGYSVVHLNRDQTLWAASSCEVFLVMGEVQCVITDPLNVENGIGMLDLTAGARLLHGDTVPEGHYLSVLTADGRGFRACGNEAYFMIRGEYTVE